MKQSSSPFELPAPAAHLTSVARQGDNAGPGFLGVHGGAAGTPPSRPVQSSAIHLGECGLFSVVSPVVLPSLPVFVSESDHISLDYLHLKQNAKVVLTRSLLVSISCSLIPCGTYMAYRTHPTDSASFPSNV